MTKPNLSILEIVSSRGLPLLRIGAGDKLFLKGEAGEAMYVVVSGTVEVLLFGRVLERVGPGGIVGEMALIDGDARCAAALTGTDTDVMAIEREQFLAITAEEPWFALAVLAVLCRRLRAITDMRTARPHVAITDAE